MYRDCPTCGTKINRVNLVGEGFCLRCQKWVALGPPMAQPVQPPLYYHTPFDGVPTARPIGGEHYQGQEQEAGTYPTPQKLPPVLFPPSPSFPLPSAPPRPPGFPTSILLPLPFPPGYYYNPNDGQTISERYGIAYRAGPRSIGFSDLKRRLSMMGLLLFYAMMIFNVIALIYAIFVVPGEIINESVRLLMFLIPFPPFLVTVDYSISGYAAVLYFLLLVSAILVSIEAIILKEGRSFFNLGKKLLSDNYLNENEEKSYDENGFVLLGELFMANLFFNVCFVIVLLLADIKMESPDFDEWHTWELMFRFARASVWEEVASRVILIGLPLLLIGSYSGKKLRIEGSSLGKQDQLEWYDYLLGGDFEITPITASLILFSSLLFGLAHMGSWDIYKVLPTLVGGLALGYLFVKKGVHVSILLHFAIDYLGVLPMALDNDIGILVEMFIGLIALVLFSLGAYMFYKYALNFVHYSLALLFKEKMVKYDRKHEGEGNNYEGGREGGDNEWMQVGGEREKTGNGYEERDGEWTQMGGEREQTEKGYEERIGEWTQVGTAKVQKGKGYEEATGEAVQGSNRGMSTRGQQQGNGHEDAAREGIRGSNREMSTRERQGNGREGANGEGIRGSSQGIGMRGQSGKGYEGATGEWTRGSCKGRDPRGESGKGYEGAAGEGL